MLITFASFATCFAQRLVKTFDMAYNQMVNDSMIIMACNICQDKPDNSVVIVNRNEDKWTIEGSISTSEFINNMNIEYIKASADGSTIAVSFVNVNSTSNSEILDDALLVFRKIANEWQLTFSLESINTSTLYRAGIVAIDFSDHGDTFILSTNKFQNQLQNEPLLTRIYSFKNGEYILDAQFAENEWDLDRAFLNLLKDNKTIILSQETVYQWTDKRFVQYNLKDNIWQRGDSFGDKEGQVLTNNYLVSDKNVSRLVTCKSDHSFNKDFNPQIEVFERDSSGSWLNIYDPYEIHEEYNFIDLDVSDNGNIIAATANNFNTAKDTLSFVDYLKFDEGKFSRLFRLSYKYPDQIDQYGLTGLIDLSPDGTHLLVQKWPQSLLYNMSSLLGIYNGSKVNSSDCETKGGRIFPNPTSGIFTTKNITYSQINIINSLGQFVGTQQAGTLTLIDYPKGIYHLKFELDGNSVCNTTIINQ